MEKVLRLIEERNFQQLRAWLEHANGADISQLLDQLDRKHLALVYRLLPKNKAVDAFARMEPDTQEHLIAALTDKELEEITACLFLDDTVDLVGEMPSNVVTRILKATGPEQRRRINEFLQYPEDSAGSMMTIEFVELKASMTVREAFACIRRTGVNKETIYTCYVLGENRRLMGVVSVKALLLAEETALIGQMMETDIIFVHTLDDREEAAKKFDKYDLLAMPVVDSEGRLVGIITVDDAIDVLQEENKEDFEIMAAMNPAEESYFKTSVWSHAKNRIFWLLLLMLSAAITGVIITRYENAFTAVPLLVAFIPMLMDTGGNCGSQSSTLIIRGLATDEICPRDLLRVLWKEARVSFIVGFILAVVNSGRILVQYKQGAMAVIVGLTLFATVVISKLLGCLLPIAAKKLKLDPAIMAAPLITTIVDTCSIFIYFNIAMAVMHL